MSDFAIKSTTEKHLNWKHVGKKYCQQNYYPLVLSVMSHTRAGGRWNVAHSRDITNQALRVVNMA